VRLSIRGRLTLWFTAVLSLVLAVSALAFYLSQWRLRLDQLDEEMAGDVALVGRLLPQELDEGQDLVGAAHGALEDIVVPGRPIAVFDGAGAMLAGDWDGLPRREGTVAVAPVETTNVTAASGPFRVLRARRQHADTSYEIAAARSLAGAELELRTLRRALASGALVALLLAAGGGWWIARGALGPVSSMAAQASRINDRTPGLRLAARNPEDELGQLALAFNELLARLEAALATQRQFMADAAHELRTPVSVARTAAEVALSQQTRAEPEYRDSLGIVASQMRRLARIVEDMLLLARADAAGLATQPAPLYLDDMVADCAKEASVIAGPKQVRVEWQGDGDLEAVGDERLLRRMLSNLLDNAVRHTPAGGRVQVQLQVRPDQFEISVTDSGGGIPPLQHQRIFERFVRLDESRGSSQGAGLGLSIARAVAESHGGQLVLSRSDESGSTFVARLPRKQPL
jgi:heavy metal sensor kinase